VKRLQLSRRAALLTAFALPAAARIFDGHSLKGWRAEGHATWLVENGELVGRQGPGGAEGDLFTEKQYKNFEFHCQWRMRFPGNSGVWFRVAGPRTGYQADFLDQPSHPGVLSGSLYCMGKAFIAENRDTKSVKPNDWNSLTITVRHDHIQITQNGRKIVDIHDATFPGPGSIGIQIHKGKAFDGMEVRLRNMKVRELQ
jgi:hypothetical protein